MRLYLGAESKNNIGYTPDWLKVHYKENGQDMALVLDIQGTIDYDRECLSCRCKGDLVPWVLWNCETGEEMVLSLLSEEEVDAVFSIPRIAEIIENGYGYEIGIYPVDDRDEVFELAEKDVLSDCEASLEMYVDEDYYLVKDFKFEVELNI